MKSCYSNTETKALISNSRIRISLLILSLIVSNQAWTAERKIEAVKKGSSVPFNGVLFDARSARDADAVLKGIDLCEEIINTFQCPSVAEAQMEVDRSRWQWIAMGIGGGFLLKGIIDLVFKETD